MGLRKFLKDSLLYGAATLLARGLAFLVLPLYTQALTQEEVGTYEWLTAVSMPMMALLPFEITQALARLRAQGLDDALHKSYARTAFVFTTLTFGGFCILTIFLLDGRDLRITGETIPSDYLLAALLLLLCNGLLYFVQNELRWSGKAEEYARTSIITAVVTATTAVVLLTIIEVGILGLYAALIAGSAAGFASALTRLPYLWKPKLSSHELAKMLRFSLPLAVASVAIILATTVDRLVVAHLLDLESLGVYGVAMRIASIAVLAVQGFQLAVLPATLGQLEGRSREVQLERSFRVFLIFGIGIALMVASTAPWLLRLLVPVGYIRAEVYIPILLIGSLSCAVYPFAPGLWLRGHSWSMASLGVCLTAIGLLMSWVLVPQGGVMGAAGAYALTGLTYGIAMFWASDKVFPVKRSYRRLSFAFGVFTGTSIVISLMAMFSIPVIGRVATALTSWAVVVFMLTYRVDRSMFIGWVQDRWYRKFS